MTKTAMTAQNTAVIVIGLDTPNCDPDALGNAATIEVAQKIAQALPAFKEKGVAVHAFYADNGNPSHRDYYPPDVIEPYAYQPDWNEIHTKRISSAFNKCLHVYQPIDMGKELKAAGKKNVILMGVNYNTDVLNTAHEALTKKFNVIVIPELVANNRLITSQKSIHIGDLKGASVEEMTDFIKSCSTVKFKKLNDCLKAL